jgi:septum formation protein
MIILASSSPRRRKLLEMLGIQHEVVPANVPEVRRPGESATAMATRLARAKAESVARDRPHALVLAADTVVVIDNDVLGKPENASEAHHMLELLSGRSHVVITAVALACPDGNTLERSDETQVWFRELSSQMIADYVTTGEPLDKAGSYGVQGYGAILVDRVEGDFFSVMGLPLRLIAEMLEDAGLPYRFTR